MEKLRLINNKQAKSFIGMKGNSITRQWKAIKYKTDKKNIDINELEYILNTTTNIEIYQEVMKLYNTQASRYNKTASAEDQKQWFTKKERTIKNVKARLEINKEKARQERLEKKKQDIEKIKVEIEEYQETTGIGKNMALTLFEQVGKTLVPNAELLGWTLQEYLEQQEVLDLLSEDLGYFDKDKRTKDFNEYQEIAKKFNKAQAIKDTDEYTTERLNNFLFEHIDTNTISGTHAGYFGYLIGKTIEIEKLKVLMQTLNAQEKMAVEEMLYSPEFLKEWCSDQESDCYDAGFREARLDELISIIENHKGIGTQFNSTTGEIETYKLNNVNKITTNLKLSNYM